MRDQFGLDLKPRTCITGAQISAHQFKIDWLEFTVKDVRPEYAIEKYLGLDPSSFVLAEHGMQGYSDFLEFETVKVLFTEERPERGSKVILSSVALDVVAVDAVEIMNRVLTDGGTFARIDLALDDRAEYLDLDVIEHAVFKAEDVTHFRKVRPFMEIDRQSRKITNRGITWGSRKSGRYLRIYDKQLEQIHAKNEPDPGHWIRVELECKKRAALAVAIRIVTSGASVIPSIVRGVLDFRDPESDSNASRRQSVGWWDAFFDGIVGISTGFKKNVTTIHDKAVWIGSQCYRSIAQVLGAFGPRVLADLIRAGFSDTDNAEWKRLVPGYTPKGKFDLAHLAHQVFKEEQFKNSTTNVGFDPETGDWFSLKCPEPSIPF